MPLHNIYSKEELVKRLQSENFNRTTLSFYRYVIIDDPEDFRNEMYKRFEELGVLGRIYIAREGVNAQLSVPEHYFSAFREYIDNNIHLKGLPFKIAVEENKPSFYKLIVKVRKKIVADGLNDDEFDVTNVGRHLSAKEFNQALNDPSSIVIDMRNHYESEVGHFKGAILPDTDTFRDTLPNAIKAVEDKKDHKILLYCTGGIRCEKASAYFKHHGFTDVNQLHGGIIDYARQVHREGLESTYVGKNFVFDDRLGERISDEIIAQCHQCGSPCDTHVNCANDDCHMLFIQCDACREKNEGCCSDKCRDIIHLPGEEQARLRKGKIKKNAHAVYRKSRWPKETV
jgi:UPF0176 protein